MCEILKCWGCRSELFHMRKAVDKRKKEFYIAICERCGIKFDLGNEEL